MDDQIKRKKESRMIKTSAVGRLTKSSELRVTSTGKKKLYKIENKNNKCQKWRTPNRFMVWMIWNRLLIIKIYLKEGENEKVNR